MRTCIAATWPRGRKRILAISLRGVHPNHSGGVSICTLTRDAVTIVKHR